MGRIFRRVRWEWFVAALIGVAIVMTSVVASDGATKPKPTVADKKATTNFGKQQAATHKAGVTKPPIVPFIRTLSFTKASNKGCPCTPVFQMQRALKLAKFRRVKVRSTGVFGKATRDQIKAFQRAHKIPPSGVYGQRTHLALTRYYDLTGRKILVQLAKDRKTAAITSGLQTIGYHYYRVGGTTLTYSQSSSRGNLGRYPALPPATDCSGLVTAIFKADGLPDPNGFNYSPVGYTGTLAQHGVRVSDWHHLRIGDLVFYGGGYPYGHVTMVIDARRQLVISHGSRGVRIEPYNYRRVSVIRRYFGTT